MGRFSRGGSLERRASAFCARLGTSEEHLSAGVVQS